MLSSLRSLFLLAALVVAPSARALPLVVWSEDSASAFDVSITGNLSPSGQTWGGSVLSPSGLWSLGSFSNLPAASVGWFDFEYLSDHTTFDGTFLPTGETFFTFDAFSASYQNVGASFGGTAEIVFSINPFWTGSASTFLTVGDNPNDYSGTVLGDTTDYTTWQYTIRLFANGPALASVPDAGLTALLLLGALGTLAFAKRRRA
jgi:hypothetical protein